MLRTLVLILLVTIPPAFAEAPPPTAEHLPKSVKSALGPMPGKIFQLLDQFSGAYWHAIQRPEIVRWKAHGDQVQIALLLGVAVAEGFIATEGKDSGEVKAAGQAVLALARGLGVGRLPLRRARSIMEYAEQQKWTAARKEWDAVLSDLDKGMIELRSEALSQLVSLGGWLRGMEALCDLVAQDYSTERAELIRQAAVIDYFETQLVAMRRTIGSRSMLTKMLKGIRKIRSLIQRDNGPLSEKTIRRVGSVCEDLVSISSKRPA